MKIAIIGHGNIGQFACDALVKYPDIENIGWFHHDEVGKVVEMRPDCALLCTPSRLTPTLAIQFLNKGISTVDSFDIHSEVVQLRRHLCSIAEAHNCTAIIAAGWDPGTDSVIRSIFKVILPGIEVYTNFGPGRSMGHTAVVKSIEGVKEALSMTYPLGFGKHERRVYIELKAGADFKMVEQKIKSDPYFINDPTSVEEVSSVDEINSLRHGVHINAQAEEDGGQNINFDMDITNPLITAQIMLACARATQRLQYGAYTMIEIPPIFYLYGDTEDIIGHLV